MRVIGRRRSRGTSRASEDKLQAERARRFLDLTRSRWMTSAGASWVRRCTLRRAQPADVFMHAVFLITAEMPAWIHYKYGYSTTSRREDEGRQGYINANH
ncbi:hypothetical protein FA13DRAFT_1459242 [Coprinellus micaceus]|uniref:Uncharacterized protein n=1 Tax=Coprinellus micaceus TaxID=71717 RepID=A0A4Y7SMT3_COPMI|nr:hypothetical protein FA13DRAFT_1459242 [Coprinellus micaceus]